MESFWSVLWSRDVPFLRYAVVACLIGSVPFGMMGGFVVVRRMSAIAGALGHAMVGGIGLAMYLNVVWHWVWLTPMLGAFVFALLSGLVIGAFFLWGRERMDTIIGAVWVIGMSLGILLLTMTPVYTDPMSYLFGNILLLSGSDLVLMGVLGGVVLLATIVCYPQMQAVSFDEDFATAKGIWVGFFQMMLILLVAATVFLMLQVMGSVMVIALLTLPAAMASLLHRRLSSVMVTSSVLAAVFSLLGMVLSYYADLPSGSVIVLMLGVAYALVFAVVNLVKSK